MQAQLDLYEQICLYKKDVIDSLHRQIEHLKEERATRCQMCADRLQILKGQIDLKDRRMDEQAQRIDKLIDKLLEKV